MPSGKKNGSTVAQTRRELKAMGPAVENSAMGAAAIELARGLDDPENSLTAKAAASKALMDIMIRMRELVPVAKSGDKVERLRARRQNRRQRLRAVS